MDYTGEHLLPGQLGHFFIVLSMVASLVASYAYFMAARAAGTPVPAMVNGGNLLQAGYRDPAAWKKLARIAFITEVVSVLAIFGILFYIIYNHLFEYHYAWKHSSRSLELKYLLACFWEGQEGSFLLWSTWHCVLGMILIRTSGKWEAPVMSVISLAQFALATMIAGIYVFGWKMGTNPFILLRDSGVLDNAPALHVNNDIHLPLRQDYLLFVRDGNGLNILLQNYWMVIHPPVLFMGFASTIVPFAFAVAGLWKKNFGEWTKPALPWALFSTAVLGVGIMMGAIWAYESLSFGGYWAWDPVENASLVPWMILVAGVHTLLIYKNSGYSLRATYLFMILAFAFILYSTFLTRTGILGEASVHAFTGEGSNLLYHLLVFMALMLVPPFVLFFRNYKSIPAVHKEENGSSREFWMFIGSLVFFLSALVIIGQTSLPVVNTVFGTTFAPPEDAEYSYNSIQVYVAIIVALLTATAQYLKYKQTPGAYFRKKILVPVIITLVITGLMIAFTNINYTKKGPGFLGAIWLAVICSVYTIVANVSYIWLGMKGKLKLSGGSISHVGFGMVLLGILVSASNKEVLSRNTSGIIAPLGEGENPMENLTLVQGQTMDMGKYKITYFGDSLHPNKEKTYFKIRFESKDGKENFVLEPNSYINFKGQEGLSSNPDARHYLTHDIFTYITSISNPDREKDTALFRPHRIKPGDSVFYSNGFMVLQDIRAKDSLPAELFGPKDSLFESPLKVYAKTGSVYSVTPRTAYINGEILAIPDTIIAESLVIRAEQVNPDRSMVLGVKESGAVLKYVTLKAYKFPWILVLWFGVIITAIGILVSMIRRIQLNRVSRPGSDI